MLSFDHDKMACRAVSSQALTVRLDCECQHMLHADSEKADVQNRLETLKEELVQNYVQEQQKLYAELLPEVTYKQPWCFPLAVMNACHHGSLFSADLLVSDNSQAVLLHPLWQRFCCHAASTEVP